MKTKINYYLLIICSITIISCSFSNYQIHEVKTSNNVNDSLMTFTKDALKISYNFWSTNGNYTCVIENTSDSMIYFDLEKSHFIYNKYATPYFSNQTTTKTTILNPTTSAPSFGFDFKYGISSSVTQEKTLLIPPHSMKLLPSFNIRSKYTNCDLKENTSYSIMNFDQQNTPIKFSNLLYYKIGNQNIWKDIQNDFWVSSILNIQAEKFYKQVAEEKCGRKTGFSVNQEAYQSPRKYYFKLIN